MKKKKTGMLVNLALISQVGIMMIVPIIAGVYIGQKLDEKIGTSFLWIICVLLGIGAAFRNLIHLGDQKASEYENDYSPSREVDQFMKKVEKERQDQLNKNDTDDKKAQNQDKP